MRATLATCCAMDAIGTASSANEAANNRLRRIKLTVPPFRTSALELYAFPRGNGNDGALPD